VIFWAAQILVDSAVVEFGLVEAEVMAEFVEICATNFFCEGGGKVDENAGGHSHLGGSGSLRL
jgi:hypothetical protein